MHDVFTLGDFDLESGAVLREARLAYATYGNLSDARDNMILVPSFITGTHEGYGPFVGPGLCFDSEQYFVVATNLFGNGLSTSPSNAQAGQRGPDFPFVSIRDNVRAQHRLISEKFGAGRLAMAAGFSMGAQQALQWAVSYPEMVERVAAWCGTARSTAHTRLVFESLKTALQGAPDWREGRYSSPPLLALRALARTYAPWGLSQGWYRRRGWEGLGFESLDAFVARFWEAHIAEVEPNDYIAQLLALQRNDVGDGEAGWNAALRSITAKTLLMPCTTDLYFPVAEAAEAAALIPDGRCIPIESDWGHFAGIGIDAASTAQIQLAVRRLLSEAPPLRDSAGATASNGVDQ